MSFKARLQPHRGSCFLMEQKAARHIFGKMAILILIFFKFVAFLSFNYISLLGRFVGFTEKLNIRTARLKEAHENRYYPGESFKQHLAK